ncbi:putative bifunctional diguanylate cyclase/phosphodiesterase [Symbioplanes lichenis]|uniref:putative bifunctional diguanylate cyclase/phosphodiesterase n=1 Tax=Symbioplanes lichenis TaxID=1629072 RepID=UPI0027393435|nr:EAL domain-containing protein [Actinoplanes lichenis]
MRLSGDQVAALAVRGGGVLLGGFVVFALGGWGSERLRTLVVDGAYVPMSVLILLLALRVVVRGGLEPAARRAWTILTAAFLCRVVAHVSWFVEDGVLGDPPFPSVADYFFLLFVPLMLAGLLLLPAVRRSRAERVKLALDSFIVLVGAAVVLWYLALGPILVSHGAGVAEVLYTAALPAGDLLLVLALAMLLLRRVTTADPTVRLLAGAVALFVVGDVAYGYVQLHTGFAAGMWIDPVWLTGDYLLALAAHRRFRTRGPVAAPAGRTGVNWLPYGAIALAYGTLGWLARGQGIYPLGGMILGAVLLTALVVARQMYALRENQILAVSDPLTGLANRTLVNRRLAEVTAQPPRDGRCTAVLLIDLDRFKPINDMYGHEAGDAVLNAVAVALRAVIRAGDTAGRLGGDEFAVVLTQLPGPSAAERIAQRLVDALRTPVILGDRVLAVEASIGVALHSPGDPAGDGDELLRRADTAMYTAKRSGRGRYQVYTPELDSRARDAALRRAVEAGELVLHYQPIVDLATGHVIAVEALVRWNHPVRGLLMPGAFVDLAEETGAVVPMGEWVLREACGQVAAWHAGVPGAEHLKVSVNLSPQQVVRADLVDVISGILGETGLSPAHLVLEITEGGVLEPDDLTVARLEALRDLGIRIAVDDFGTGYSALSYLRRLPVDTLKIDRSFVTGIERDPDARSVAEAVVRLGMAFHMAVVAEGIETAEQARELADMGCGLGQGYHFHRPLVADAVPAALATPSSVRGTG